MPTGDFADVSASVRRDCCRRVTDRKHRNDESAMPGSIGVLDAARAVQGLRGRCC
jgi:hypothetical protein